LLTIERRSSGWETIGGGVARGFAVDDGRTGRADDPPGAGVATWDDGADWLPPVKN